MRPIRTTRFAGWLLLGALLALASVSAAQEEQNAPTIATGDLLYINVDGKVDAYTVSPSGAVELPDLGSFEAAGKTYDEVRDAIVGRWLNRRYEEQPEFRLERKPGLSGPFEAGQVVTISVGGAEYVEEVKLDGTLKIQLVGPVRVSGLTPDQALQTVYEQWRGKQAVRVYVQSVTPWVQHKGMWWLWVLVLFTACMLFIFAMTRMNHRYRRWVIAFFVFVAGLFWVLEFFLPTRMFGMPEGQNILTPFVGNIVAPAANVIGGILLGLGVFSLLRVHGGRVRKGGANWPFSLILLLCIPVMATVVLTYRVPDNPYTLSPFWQLSHEALFENLFAPMESAMFSMIAFFIMSAAYRAFRLRSVEASIMMLAALIVSVGLLPVGQQVTGWLPAHGILASARLENLAQWFLTIINTPALRAIEFGIGVGVVAMSLRIWLNIERGALFD